MQLISGKTSIYTQVFFHIQFYEYLHFMILLNNRNKSENAKEWVLSASQLMWKTNLYEIKIRQIHFLLSTRIDDNI